ncbi:hypothetical protein WJX82_002681 [Trebouxia sp. C0006]
MIMYGGVTGNRVDFCFCSLVLQGHDPGFLFLLLTPPVLFHAADSCPQAHLSHSACHITLLGAIEVGSGAVMTGYRHRLRPGLMGSNLEVSADDIQRIPHTSRYYFQCTDSKRCWKDLYFFHMKAFLKKTMKSTTGGVQLPRRQQ